MPLSAYGTRVREHHGTEKKRDWQQPISSWGDAYLTGPGGPSGVGRCHSNWQFDGTIWPDGDTRCRISEYRTGDLAHVQQDTLRHAVDSDRRFGHRANSVRR